MIWELLVPSSFFPWWPLWPPTPHCVIGGRQLKALCEERPGPHFGLSPSSVFAAAPRFYCWLKPWWRKSSIMMPKWSSLSYSRSKVAEKIKCLIFQVESGRGCWRTKENRGSVWRRWSSSWRGESEPCDIRSQHSNSDMSQHSNMALKNGEEESVTLIAFLVISCLNQHSLKRGREGILVRLTLWDRALVSLWMHFWACI